MSGICGVVHFDGRVVPPGAVGAMAGAAPHRGRDGTREWATPTIQLAHQAIHITPESSNDQPIVGDGGRRVLVGAIRLDARDELVRQLGRELRSASDAALVMAAFQKWGAGCVAHLLGDFAFAIIDTLRHTVLLARDPFGIRSLYYRLEPGKRMVFATEAAQVLVAPGVPVKPFEPAIAAHLAGPYGLPEWSFYDGVTQLPAGCTLQVDENGQGRVGRFWDIDPEARIHYRNEHDYAEHFREIFLGAVGDRLRSQGPVGIQLSGGMDSGSTASAAGHLAEVNGTDPASIRTYSWAFRELTDSDERSVSDRIVRAFGITGVPVFADDLWPLAGFPGHGPVRDDPFVLVYTAAGDATRRAAYDDGVRLLLVAQSGDEVVGTQWVADYLRLLDAGRPGLLWKELRSHASSTDDGFAAAAYRHVLRPLAGRVKRRLVGSGPRQVAKPPYPPWIRSEFASRANLMDTIDQYRMGRKPGPGAGPTRHRTVFSLSAQRWATDLERRHARAGLGYSDPFSDRRVVEYILSIPQAVVNRPADGSKRLLRAAMKGVIPDDALRTAHKLIPASLHARGVYEKGRPALLELTDTMLATEWGYVDQTLARRAIESWTMDDPAPAFDPWWLISLEWWLRSHW